MLERICQNLTNRMDHWMRSHGQRRVFYYRAWPIVAFVCSFFIVTCDLFIKTAGDDVARKGRRNEKVKRGGWRVVGRGKVRVKGQQKKNTHFLCENTKIISERAGVSSPKMMKGICCVENV